MIELPFLASHTVAVMGLGRSGMASAEALSRSGATVWAWDDDGARREEAAARGIPVVDLASADLAVPAMLLWSPGIPHTHPRPHPVAMRARAAGRPIICDVELLARAQPKATYVAVTGTNGKSTTTALIAHILRTTGRRAEAGANLGTPALALAPLVRGGVYVLELSSYQLELIDTARFDVSVLLNVTPDHLGRHGGMDGYLAAKRRILDHAKASGTIVIGFDDGPCRSLFSGFAGAVPISAQAELERGVYAPEGLLIDHRRPAPQVVLDLRPIPTLPGRHNWQNAAAAYAAACAVGCDPRAVCDAIASYPGLPHRQELVATIGGIAYVNDSKATNADAAEKALVCYDRIYWIAGGLPKEGGIEALRPHFGRIAHAFLIGQAADEFAGTLDGAVPHTQCGDLATAVARAHAMAQAEGGKGAVVLLSPACASWDQFASFEARGDAFRAAVEKLRTGREARP